MFLPSQVIPMLLEADPGFLQSWQHHLEFWADHEPGEDDEDALDGNPRGYYNDAHAFSDYLWQCLRENRTDRFPAIFAVFEQIIADPDEDEADSSAYNLVHIGIFEDLLYEIQRLQEQDRITPTEWDREIFARWLGPASHRAWVEAGGHTGLYNHAIWEEPAPRFISRMDGPAIDLTDARLLATDCRIRNRGLQGRALHRVDDGQNLLWFVDGTQQDAFNLAQGAAEQVYARMEHPVLRRQDAFPGADLRANKLTTPPSAVLQPTSVELLRQIVRGERHWTTIEEKMGSISLQKLALGWYASWHDAAIAPKHPNSDVLEGFRAYLTDPGALQQWSFLIWASDIWEPQSRAGFKGFQDDIEVRIGLRDAAFREPLRPELLQLIER